MLASPIPPFLLPLMSTTARGVRLIPAMSHLSKFYLPCLRILDHVLLLQTGLAYLARFCKFAEAADGGVQGVNHWRAEQQAEWNRLTISLSFLATMSAAILAISPPAPPLASSVWLGAAGLSTCGLFIVQFISIQAFSISDEEMVKLVKNRNFLNSALLAIAVGSPIVITLWTSIFFAIGILDYIIENTHDKLPFMLVSLVPVTIAFMVSIVVMITGNIIGQRVQTRSKSGPLLTRWLGFCPNDGNNSPEVSASLTQTSVGAHAPGPGPAQS